MEGGEQIGIWAEGGQQLDMRVEGGDCEQLAQREEGFEQQDRREGEWI